MVQQNGHQLRSLLRILRPQIFLLAILALFYSLSLAGSLPSPRDLNSLLLRLFKQHGLPIIALSSFIENLIGVNAYFPGAFTILFGMSLTAGNPSKAFATYIAIYIPAYIANVISFFLGNWQCRQDAIDKIPTSGKTWSWLFLTYWHPQLAAITAFSAGVRHQIPRRLFLSISFVASLFWSLFWAFLIYHFGLLANIGDYFAVLFLAYLLVWIAKDVLKFRTTQTIGRNDSSSFSLSRPNHHAE
jgi:membrane protein DedA with SNARE-associated domain